MSASLSIPRSSGLIEKSDGSARCRVAGSAKWSVQCAANLLSVSTLLSRYMAVTSRQIHHSSVSCALKKPPMGIPVVPCKRIRGPMVKKQLLNSSNSTILDLLFPAQPAVMRVLLDVPIPERGVSEKR